MNQPGVKPRTYQYALDLAEKGCHVEALNHIQTYLESAPQDAEALNDTAMLLWCLGRAEQAIDYLERARRIEPDAGEIVWNLFEIYVATDQGQRAGTLLDDMESMGLLSADALNRAARALMDQGKPEQALTLLQRSLALSPNQPILEPIMEVVRHKSNPTQADLSAWAESALGEAQDDDNNL